MESVLQLLQLLKLLKLLQPNNITKNITNII
jgi:hypothetical protein